MFEEYSSKLDGYKVNENTEDFDDDFESEDGYNEEFDSKELYEELEVLTQDF
jgi:hypothetical protein